MNRLKKELMKRCIIHGVSETNGYDPYEVETELVGICNGFVITCTFCNVVEPELNIYDARTLKYIGRQSTEKDTHYFDGAICFNPWSSWVEVGEDNWEDYYEDDYSSNMPCDTYGMCAGTSCSNYYKCHN